jgi:phosphatidylinositol alpha-1,6-mannosyltransferase
MEWMLYQLVQHLAPSIEVQVIAPYAASHDTDEDQHVVRSSRDGLLWFVGYTLWTSVRVLHKHDYHVILAGSMLVVPIACLLGWLFKRPVVAIGHGLDLIYPHPLYQKMVHTFLPRCQRVIAVSQVVREAAMDRGIDQDNVTIIPPGVQYEEFAGAIDVKAVRRTYALANRPVILSVGRLARRKGVLEFVRYALPQIVASFPQVVFLVVGDNPHLSLAHKEDMRTRIQDEVTRLGLATH